MRATFKKSVGCAVLLVAQLCLTTAHASASKSYTDFMDEARAAYEAEDWPTMAVSLEAAQAKRPYSLYTTRNLVLAYALLEDFDRAIEIMQLLADRGLSVALKGHPAYETLAATPAFAAIAARMKKNESPVGEATVAYRASRDDLLPESFVQDPKSNRNFVSSVRKGFILPLSADENTVEPFAEAPGGVYGLEIIDGALWAAVNSASPFEKAPAEGATAGLYAYSLEDGSLTASAAVNDSKALLGDLENTPYGVVASDSITPRLYLFRSDTPPTIFSEDPRFANLQGLAYDKRRTRLFVADSLTGLYSVDMNDAAVTQISNKANEHIGSIDGLYLHDGDLIGIQNVTTPQRIVRIKLNRRGDTVKGLEVIQQNLPEWREPTNGQVVGDTLYYVATSNWPAYDGDGVVKEDVDRADVKIMTAPLKK